MTSGSESASPQGKGLSAAPEGRGRKSFQNIPCQEPPFQVPLAQTKHCEDAAMQSEEHRCWRVFHKRNLVRNLE